MSQSSIRPSKMVFLYKHFFLERASVSLIMFSAKQGYHFITSLVWSDPWLRIEPRTSRTRSQHAITTLIIIDEAVKLHLPCMNSQKICLISNIYLNMYFNLFQTWNKTHAFSTSSARGTCMELTKS